MADPLETKFKREMLAKLREFLSDGKARHAALVARYREAAERLERELA
jgi:hypothetical protein